MASSRRSNCRCKGSLFPSHIPVDGEPRPTRTAWCYGDLGVAAVLLSAAQSFDRADWQEEALAIASVGARRPFEETMATDAGLCHGATGIAHLFNRIYQATGDEEIRDAAQTWYRTTLDMRRPGQGIAGYLSWIVDPPGPGVWKAEPDFCRRRRHRPRAARRGHGHRAVWDRVLLVGVPPRNGVSAAMKDFIPSGLVVMRTPLLPMEELDAWSAGTAIAACR